MAASATEEVVLVNGRDEVLGFMDKLGAHREGLLHRAFSVFIFNTAGRLLLQQRAEGKYHSGGLWTNSCCGHPRPGEAIADAASRRLHEELGIRCDLRPQFTFLYRADVGHHLVEHELDHVFFGHHDGELHPDPSEVQGTRWIRMNDLEDDLATSPLTYTAWLPHCWPQVRERYAEGHRK